MAQAKLQNKTAFIHARVRPDVKRDAEKILTKVGISMTDAINMFLAQVNLKKGLPFSPNIPNAETRAALREDTSKLKGYTSTQEMMDDILGKGWEGKQGKKHA